MNFLVLRHYVNGEICVSPNTSKKIVKMDSLDHDSETHKDTFLCLYTVISLNAKPGRGIVLMVLVFSSSSGRFLPPVKKEGR